MPPAVRKTLTLRAKSTEVLGVAVSPDGRYIACGTEPGRVFVWEAPAQVAAAQAARRQMLGNTLLPWHRDSAAASERAGQMFAAAFHLSRLLDVEPENAGYRVRRGDAYARRGRPVEAAADFTKALALKASLTLEECAVAHAGLAQWSQAAGLFRDAAVDFATKVTARRAKDAKRQEERLRTEGAVVRTSDPSADDEREVSLWYRSALIHLHLGDHAAYRRICALAFEKFGSTKDTQRAVNDLVWLCAVGPNALPDLAPAVQLMEAAVKKFPNSQTFRHTLGYIYYRAGRYEEAEKAVARPGRDVAKDSTLLTTNWYAIPMAMYHLGKHTEARQVLTDLAKTAASSDAERRWTVRLENEVMRREAEALVK